MTALLLALAIVAAPSDKPQVLAFKAEWCGPCKRMEVTLRQVEAQGYKVTRIDVDKQPALAQKYGVKSLPTCVVLDAKGNERGRTEGFVALKVLLKLLKLAAKLLL